MSRVELFTSVLEKCERLAAEGMEAVWGPITDQLTYLIRYENGEAVDRTMIQNIDVGLRALRNLADIYPEIAKDLFEVQRVAEQMAEDNGMRNRLKII